MGIQSIERASAILRALASGPRRLGVSDLSDRLGLAKGTTHGILRTLQRVGFVEQVANGVSVRMAVLYLLLGGADLAATTALATTQAEVSR